MNTRVLIISGRVQGVFFRANAKKEADKLGLAGYAQNLPDGTVECLIQGDTANIKKFTNWALTGTPPARVESVIEKDLNSQEKHTGFRIK